MVCCSGAGVIFVARLALVELVVTNGLAISCFLNCRGLATAARPGTAACPCTGVLCLLYHTTMSNGLFEDLSWD